RSGKPAVVRVDRDDGRFARFAAFEHGLLAVEQQVAFDFLRRGAMALVTTLHEHGSDFLFEKVAGVRIRLFGNGGDESNPDHAHQTASAVFQTEAPHSRNRTNIRMRERESQGIHWPAPINAPKRLGGFEVTVK